MATKVVKEARKHGILGATITMAKGTVSDKILNYIGLCDIRKEIVFIVAPSDVAETTIKALNDKFKFDRPNHGIAFTSTVLKVVGTKSCEACQDQIVREDDELVYNNIVIIVEKGNAEAVVEAAEHAGSRGGTIINARGSGIHETSKLFSIEIEPEKEIVMIISEESQTDAIVNKIQEEFNIEEPGNGIIFIQPLNKVYGLYK